jgi:hydrogenase maturation factor
MNTTEIQSRLFEIGREEQAAMKAIEQAAREVREAANTSNVSAGDYALLNAGLMLEKVAVVAACGVDARRRLTLLLDERKQLEGML